MAVTLGHMAKMADRKVPVKKMAPSKTKKECIERKLSYSKSSPESSSTPEQTYTLFNENSSTVSYFTITFNV